MQPNRLLHLSDSGHAEARRDIHPENHSLGNNGELTVECTMEEQGLTETNLHGTALPRLNAALDDISLTKAVSDEIKVQDIPAESLGHNEIENYLYVSRFTIDPFQHDWPHWN